MSLTARILSRSALHGPSVLDLLDHFASRPGDLTLLHSAHNSGFSILAAEPVLTLEINAIGQPFWHIAPSAQDFAARLPTSDELANLSVCDAFRCMLQSILVDDSASRVPLVGWLGAISYDINRFLESIPSHAQDDLQWPLLRWTLFDAYFIYDHQQKLWTIATLEWSALRDELAESRLDRLESILSQVEPEDHFPTISSQMRHCLTPAEYQKRIARVKEYIAAGDIYQANLAQRWTIQTDGQPHHIYRNIYSVSPAEFASYMRFDNHAVVSASPELFLERHGPQLKTRPIKGTRRRDLANLAHDETLKQDLLNSPKDQAELAMIVDLLRNDLGRISEFGSVQVVAPRELEALPTVWHTSARIESKIDRNRDIHWSDIIAALCPGGSITGAPKIRAMQIIEELEEFRRHWYCGNIGWIGPRQTGTLNIAIRTILMHKNLAYVYAGGGIVADSSEIDEYDETIAKAQAMFKALNLKDLAH